MNIIEVKNTVSAILSVTPQGYVLLPGRNTETH